MCMNKNGAIINIRPWLRWKIHLRLDYECSKYFNRNIIHFKMNAYHTCLWEWLAILSMLIKWSEAYPTYVGMIPVKFQESEVAHVYPMYVGMTRRSAQSSVKFVGSFHACGNEPCLYVLQQDYGASIPRVWEWVGEKSHFWKISGVYPTYVGMIRMDFVQGPCSWSLSRVCGNDS